MQLGQFSSPSLLFAFEKQNLQAEGGKTKHPLDLETEAPERAFVAAKAGRVTGSGRSLPRISYPETCPNAATEQISDSGAEKLP